MNLEWGNENARVVRYRKSPHNFYCNFSTNTLQFALTGATDDLRRRQDEAGINVSRDYLRGLIQAEIDSGIPAERIVIGGFSQGGAMALLTGLTAKVKLAGIVGLSSYVPLDDKLPVLLQETNLNQKTPIFMAHGSVDMVVPTAFGKLSVEMLKKAAFDVTFKEYPYVMCDHLELTKADFKTEGWVTRHAWRSLTKLSLSWETACLPWAMSKSRSYEALMHLSPFSYGGLLVHSYRLLMFSC
jgi:predicted esterase